MTTKKGQCKQCQRETQFVLHQQIFVSGSINFLWVCSFCETRNPGRGNKFFIPHDTIKKHLTQEQIDALPKLLPDLMVRCARCGHRECELHHWAPQHLFDDSEDWPKDYLCRDCHDLWHKVVTPNMGGSNGPL